MNDYWIVKAAQAESECEILRQELDSMYKMFQARINELEQLLIAANNAATMNSIEKVDNNV